MEPKPFYQFMNEIASPDAKFVSYPFQKGMEHLNKIKPSRYSATMRNMKILSDAFPTIKFDEIQIRQFPFQLDLKIFGTVNGHKFEYRYIGLNDGASRIFKVEGMEAGEWARKDGWVNITAAKMIKVPS